ncbi:MAG: nitroreductase family protein [Acutalibacteraceae bacterium]
MDDIFEIIKTRRSIRAFKPDEVDEALLNKVLEAGTYAPTGRGLQSPVIVAVRDKETRDYVSSLNAKVLGTNTDPYYGAPVIVLVLADGERNTFIEDGSCVLENMMLMAHALGLGSCWIHREQEIFDSAEGKALLEKWGLPQTLRGVGSLALGYPDQAPPTAKERKKDYIIKI